METITFSKISREDLQTGVASFEARLQDGRIVTLAPVDVGYWLLDQLAKGSLPTTDPTGQLRRVTDQERGLWTKTAHHWYGLTGEVLNAKEFCTGGSGTDADPWTGWEAHVFQKKPVYFPHGVYQMDGTTVTRGSGTEAVHWFGAGMEDANTGTTNRTKIVGSTTSADALLKCVGVRYLCLRDLTLDANSRKASCVIVDGPSVVGFNFTNVRMLGARTDTLDVAPTAGTQVSESVLINCLLQSAAPSSSQLRIRSTNAINIAWYEGICAGAGPYNIRLANCGQLTVHNVSFSDATTADIFLETESSVIRAYNCHTETTVRFLYAPAAVPAASYQGQSSIIEGVNHSVTPAADSVTIAQTRALEMRNCFWGGDVTVTSPATVFVSGPVTFGSGKAFTGTGAVQRWLSVTDTVSTDATGANSPHCIANRIGVGTALAEFMINGELYLPDRRGIRWGKTSGTAYGGGLFFRHLASVANDGTSTLLTASGGANILGPVWIVTSEGDTAILLFTTSTPGVTLVSDPSTRFSTSAGTASRTNVYWDTSQFMLQNKRGAAVSYALWFMTTAA